jgi:hypothetical protein
MSQDKKQKGFMDCVKVLLYKHIYIYFKRLTTILTCPEKKDNT